MSKFKIPTEDRRLNQINDGEIFGNIWLSQNLDLKSNKGKINVSPRLLVGTDYSDDTSMVGGVSSFAKFKTAKGGTLSGYWAQVGVVLFKIVAGSAPTTTFIQDEITGTPVDLSYLLSDMVTAPNGLLVTNNENIYLFDGTNDWVSYWKTTLSQTMNDTIGSHCLEVLYTQSVAVSDLNRIHTINTGTSAVSKNLVTLKTEDKILWIKTASTRVWIGTINTTGGEGLVYEWDGASATTTRAYKIGATGALAGVIKNDIPYIMTSDGSLKVFNGSGFQTIAQLPHTKSPYLLKNSTLSTAGNGNDRWIHPNGMKLIDGSINILINNVLEETSDYTNLIENEPSGIWEYNEEVGLYHKYSFTLDKTGALDHGQNGINYAGALFETKAKESSLLAGATVITSSTATNTAVFYDDLLNTIAKRGFLVTPWLQSNEIQDVWQKLWIKFKDFDNATDKIIVKYRVKKDKDLPAIYSSTYTSTTTFTITSATNLLTTTNILDVGNEVEIIIASGSGTTAHISSVDVAGTYTYTVTLDEAICPASGTGKVRFNNFKKLGTITNQNITNQFFTLGEKATEMQIKLELRGTGNNPEINQVVVLSNTDLPV